MKLVISNNWGSFSLPREVAKVLNVNKYNNNPVYRYDQNLINWVKTNDPEEDKYKIVTVPDDATDYKILDYDGIENVIYVQNGKIKYAK